MKNLLLVFLFLSAFMNYVNLKAQPLNDDIAFATVIPHNDGWASSNAAFTTNGATADGNAASCWNTSPNYNVWFRFQATTSIAKITIRRGGVYGTIARINAAIWQSDGSTQVACRRYVNDYDNVIIQTLTLVPGNWYYLSVDNNYSGYRGTFSLLMETAVDYDYYEGAYEIVSPSDWCSANAQFTTIGATPDKNAGSCWNTSPNYNRWFKFQVTGSGMISIQILRGGSYGTIQGINAALWEANGTTQVACSRYVNVSDNVILQRSGLTVGNWYYISVDNYYSGYRGSFSICMNDGSLEWNGLVNSDWDNAGNWNGGVVPDEFINVSIPGGAPNYPVIPGHLSVGTAFSGIKCRTLTIDNGASVTVTGWGQISIYNNTIINTGGVLNVESIIMGTSGKLYIFGGTVTANDYSVFSYGTGGNMTSGSLTLNSTDFLETNWYASGGTIYLNAVTPDDLELNVEGTLNIYNLQVNNDTKVLSDGYANISNNFTIQPTGKFDLVSGTINVSGSTLFEADATGMGQFIDRGTLNVSGSSTVEQYLISERWHFVSPPISDAQIGVYYNIYLKEFNEPTNAWNYLVLPVTIPMDVTKGYSAWAADDLTGTTTVSYTGQLNLGNNYTITPLSYTPASPGVGWNMVGNPYPAPLQWNSSWSKTNLSEWACIHSNGHDECYNAATQTGWPNSGDMADGIIPSTQGFWVRATAPNASLTIPQSERTFSDQTFYKGSTVSVNESLRLKVEGNNDFDVMLIQFIPGSTQGYDGSFDLEKRWGMEEAPQIFSINTNNEYFSVNALPELAENMILPVGLKVGWGNNYSITLTEFENFSKDITVILEDLKMNTFSEFSLNSIYHFYASPVDDYHRFNLHFKTSAFGTEEFAIQNPAIYSYDRVVYIQMPENSIAEVAIFDLMGRELTRQKTDGYLISRINLNVQTGYYIVQVMSNNQVVTRKVFIK